MIQDAVSRVAPVAPPTQIIISTSAALAPEIRRQVPAVPDANYLLEPVGRNTAPCVGLAAMLIVRARPDAVMAVLTADHIIADPAAFRDTLECAAAAAMELNSIIAFGVIPDKPETGYGYIEAAEPVTTLRGRTIRKAVRFVEKPDLKTAEGFVASGRYRYNSGMFVCPARLLIEEFQKHAPDLHEPLSRIAATAGTPAWDAAMAEIFPQITSISIDYAILEHTSRLLMIDAAFGWNDLGSWSTLYDLSPKDENGNAVVGRALLPDSRGCYVHSPGKLVAALGVENLVIVETEDALLVCPRDRAQEIRRIVDMLKEAKLDEML